jgi:hypothetical protein
MSHNSLIINNLLYILPNFAISFLILLLVLKFIKGIFPNFFLNRLVPNSLFISTILSLKDSSRPRNIKIVTILGISSHDKFLDTLWTFHSKFIYLCRVKVPDPSFHGVKSNAFGDHVLAALASYVKWCLISYFTAAYSLTLYDDEWICLYFFW